MNFTSSPWIHHDDLYGNNLLQARPSFLGRIRSVYDEKLRVVLKKLFRDRQVWFNQGPDGALETGLLKSFTHVVNALFDEYEIYHAVGPDHWPLFRKAPAQCIISPEPLPCVEQ